MIKINGVTYSGTKVSIINGNIIIDGTSIKGKVSGVIEIRIEGNPASIETDANVTVKGNVQGNIDAGGNITCTNVQGGADAGGNISCCNIAGSADAGGNIICSGSR